jgi:hypothetical protein
MQPDVSPHRARLTRDTGLARLRRLTGAAVAAALGLSAIFAGAAASSTHPRKPVRAVRVRAVRHSVSTPALPPARAPALNGEDAAPSPSPAPPASPPAAAVSPPVAVSGGS